jgi:hypothetical protein
MPFWSELIVEGEATDLSHLEPFQFVVVPIGLEGDATISVRFHDHCFTEIFDPAKHGSAIRTNQASSSEMRAFSAKRYELSKLLPNIVRQMDGQKIASTREGNMVKVTLQNGQTYPVFFTLRRAGKRRVDLFLVSAYVWDKPAAPATTGSMKFNLAVAKVLKGERPVFPSKEQKRAPRDPFKHLATACEYSALRGTLAGGGGCLSQSDTPMNDICILMAQKSRNCASSGLPKATASSVSQTPPRP